MSEVSTLNLNESRNWKKYFQEKSNQILYSSEDIQFEVFSEKNSKDLRFVIMLLMTGKEYKNDEFVNFIDLCRIFTTSITNYEIEKVIVHNNEWTLYSKKLDFSDDTRQKLQKIYSLLVIIFNDLKKLLHK